VTDVVRTPDEDIRISGKVECANVTFTEVDPRYEPEADSASREVTRRELEYALSIISRRNAPQGQRAT
jgi:hypothetical protein